MSDSGEHSTEEVTEALDVLHPLVQETLLPFRVVALETQLEEMVQAVADATDNTRKMMQYVDQEIGDLTDRMDNRFWYKVRMEALSFFNWLCKIVDPEPESK